MSENGSNWPETVIDDRRPAAEWKGMEYEARCGSRTENGPRAEVGGLEKIGGERGIRTLDGLLTHTPLAGERLQPLGHLSLQEPLVIRPIMVTLDL